MRLISTLALLAIAAGCGAPIDPRNEAPLSEEQNLEAKLCAENQHVVSHACAVCPVGMTNDAGDDTTGGDTKCDATLCLADQHVVRHACTACPSNTTNDAGDDAGGADTTCDVVDVNLQPNLPNAVTHVAALPETKTAFSFAPVDPEGDAFTVSFKGCAKNQGVIEICETAACVNTTVLDCSVPYSSGNAPQLLNVELPITGYFTSGVVERSFAAAKAYNTAFFVFEDNASEEVAQDTAVVFDVRIVNRAPKIYVADMLVESYAVTVGLGAAFNPALQIVDDDFVNEFDNSAVYSVVLTVDAANPLDVAGISARLVACLDTVELSATRFAYTCHFNAVNDVLNGVAILSPAVTPENDGLTTTMSFTVSDLGYYGQCENILTYDETPCPLGDTLPIDVTWQQVP